LYHESNAHQDIYKQKRLDTDEVFFCKELPALFAGGAGSRHLHDFGLFFQRHVVL